MLKINLPIVSIALSFLGVANGQQESNANKVFVPLELDDKGLSHSHNDTDYTNATNIQSFRVNFMHGLKLEKVTNLTGTIYQADKTGPLVVPDQPWEGKDKELSGVWFSGNGVVYDKDEKIFKMFYSAQANIDGKFTNLGCLATSKDGINWEKPNLGKTTVLGNKNNNVIGGGYSVAIDYKAPADKKYKGWAYTGSGHASFESPNGINWSKIADYPQKMGDVTTMVYDAVKREYLFNTKGSERDAEGYNTRKAFALSSQDLASWSKPKEMSGLHDQTDAKGYARAGTYGISFMPYEGMYIGFHWLFLISELQGNGLQDGLIEVDLLSKTGQYLNPWKAVSATPIIPRGPKGSWDYGMITPANTPLIVNNEIWLYYSGFDNTHMGMPRTAKIGLARWRLDGFISADASETEGEIITSPIYFTGKRLFLNAKIDDYIRVEILNRNNEIIGEYNQANTDNVSGDNIAHLIKWKGSSNLQSLEGKVIKLRFLMKNAQLFSYYFK